ncbi:hypothetical protein H8A95_20235 [Bradyrhizobium sp. Pear76]|uniref:DUF1801 domain-containing protein n=1 Tax=Bradyrhizobium oropedii TaxID=1571201 RepID=UPI001E4A099F|nr:DUF1801 domain-containing protein [Bradyrhizobium oropedii]MCC8964579.1 hypothetical protein [Bradyrhizobium oropedii]
MFRVAADSLEAYLAFDPARTADLEQVHAVMRKAAPSLQRHFHAGSPAGEAGMRMNIIGYGQFRYAIKSGKTAVWPVIGLALQKNYISVYVAVTRGGKPLVSCYAGTLGELRAGGNNFSFETFVDLKASAVAALFAEAADIFKADQENPVRYMQGS